MILPKLVITIVLTLVLFFFIYESEGASYSTASHIDGHGAGTASFAKQEVNLSVYYESLSKSSAIFIIKDLGKIFNDDLISIVNLQLVPWANAYVSHTNNSISCQNGQDECELNSVVSCAINLWPKEVDKYYGLISCLAFSTIDRSNNNWKDCLNQLGLPIVPIENCFYSGNGTELGKKYIKQSAQLYPPPLSVPWVVVNNHPIGKDYANFTYYVCKAYRGVAVPKTCNIY